MERSSGAAVNRDGVASIIRHPSTELFVNANLDANLYTKSLVALAMVLRKDYLNINGHKLPTNCRECFLWYPLNVKQAP